MIQVTKTFAETRAAVAGSGVVGFVPTMGYLHEGHLANMEKARQECDLVLASIFVNPLQFAPTEDLARYPRNLERDVELAASVGASVVFAPPLDEMYSETAATRVTVEALTITLEGRYRPGHLEGVATVVTTLFAGLQPDRAYFGRKDAQQLAVVTHLARDLAFPIEVVPVSIVRESDGLALSSRNTYLSADDRRSALSLSRGLMSAADAAEAGERSAEVLERLALEAMEDAPGVEPIYAALADAAEVTHPPQLRGDSFLAVAAKVGTTRLIDAVHFDVGEAGVVADRGQRLTSPSILRHN